MMSFLSFFEYAGGAGNGIELWEPCSARKIVGDYQNICNQAHPTKLKRKRKQERKQGKPKEMNDKKSKRNQNFEVCICGIIPALGVWRIVGYFRYKS